MSTQLNIPLVEITLSPNEEKCKYCLDTISETKYKFLKPCSCTNPICENCLKNHIQQTQRKTCELCDNSYQIPTLYYNQQNIFTKKLKIFLILLFIIIIFCLLIGAIVGYVIARGIQQH